MPRARLSGAGIKLFLVAALAFLGGCATQGYFSDAGPAPAAHRIALERWPHPDIWTGIIFNGEKVGFTHRAVRPAPGAPGRFEVASEAAIRAEMERRFARRGISGRAA